MTKLNERGFIQVFLFLLLLAGLGVGVYLVQTRTGWFSKAAPVTPQTPETSFELEVQGGTSEPFADDPVKLTGVGVGAKFRVDVWVRSDIDPANLFVAKLKFPTDLLQVVEINKRGANSFVNQWIADPSFDNSSGNISIIGGVNPPGLLTSTQSSGSVKGVTSGPTADIGTVGPGGADFISEGESRMAKVGSRDTFVAAISSRAKSGQIWVTKGDGKSEFPCPSGENGKPYKASTGFYWCKLGEKGDSLGIEGYQFTGGYTYSEPGMYTAVINAYTSANYGGATPVDRCSGTPVSLGFDSSKWSDCGSGSRMTVIVSSAVSSLEATLEGPNTLKAGEKGNFKATLSGGAKGGQIWVTKGDGKSEFPCPSGENGKPYKASTGFYWCKVAEWKGPSIEGSYGTSEVGEYTAVVNAFSNDTSTYTGDPATECSGTPASLGFDASKWSDCGSSSRLTVNVLGITPTPISTEPPSKSTLMVPRLMVSIIFEAKKQGTANIKFTDSSQILRNSDGINIISAKKGLTLQVVAAPISAPITTPIAVPTSAPSPAVSTPTPSSTSGSCVITSVSWQIDQGHIFQGVNIFPRTDTEGYGCRGKYVHFEIRRNGVLTGDVPANVQPQDGVIASGNNVAVASWRTEYSPLLPFTDPDYYFKANIIGDSTVVKSGLLRVISAGGGSTPTPTPTPTPVPGQTLVCNSVTARPDSYAPLGKYQGQDVYIMDQDKLVIDLVMNVSPKEIAAFGYFDKPQPVFLGDEAMTLESTTGISNFGARFIAPKKRPNKAQLFTITSEVGYYPAKYDANGSTVKVKCPDVRVLVEPVQQATTSTQSVSSTEIKNLRHDGDINGDSKINLVDMSRLLAQFGKSVQSEADLNGDGVVNTVDVLLLRNILIKNGTLNDR